MDILLIILIAFSVALVFSMLGLGGAIVYTPFFFWLGLPLLIAIPMALLLNAITTASASITYLKQRLVKTRTAIPIIAASIPGTFAGSYLALRMNTALLIMLLSAILFFASIRILLSDHIGFATGVTEKKKIAFSSFAGFLIGVTSSLAGIGGGTFIVPLLMMIGFETKEAVATSSFIVTFISFSGFIGHLGFSYTQIEMSLLFYAGAAAFLGAQTGSRVIFRHTSSRTISRIFALVLLLVAGQLLYSLCGVC